jgi:hypothetical protein
MALEAWVRRSQRVIRMVSELHRFGYQRLRIMPYEHGLAWRCFVAPSDDFSVRNGAFSLRNDQPNSLGEKTTYSQKSDTAYFEWQDANLDTARKLAEKFVQRFPLTSEAGRGRDWAYAGWLAELVGTLERGNLLPFVRAEYFEPEPEALRCLPIRDIDDDWRVRMDFPLPPPPPEDATT